jgi:threonine dehydrogenase-like Zn-dependent dehydrogenase
MASHYSAMIVGPGKFKLAKTRTPLPGRNQVKVRLEGCGVCGSNLPVWQGRTWFNYPFEAGAPGHEGWGVIEDTGPDVTSVTAGNRVALLSYHAFGEVEVVDESGLVRLPPALDGEDFPGEALGCAINIHRRSDIQKGHHVAVIGAGFLGCLLIQLAAAAGAVVIAVSRRSASLETALAMGATHVVPMHDHNEIIREVAGLTNGSFCERVMEATGSQWPLDLAGELCAERGKLVIAGYHQDGPRQVNMQLWNWRGIDVVNAHERDSATYLDGMRGAVNAILEGRMDPRPLYTHQFTLPQISDAFRLLDSRDGSFMKALVTFS